MEPNKKYLLGGNQMEDPNAEALNAFNRFLTGRALLEPNRILVNHAELLRLRDELDEHLASGLSLYRRIDNLITQGTLEK